MTGIWDKICDVFSNLVKPTRRKTRVTFSPSTLQRELERHTKLAATPNPFFNFLAELRLKCKENDDYNNRSLNQREVVKISKRAGLLWKSMSEEEKQPYRKMAMEQRKLKRLRHRRRSPWTSSSRRRRKKSKSLTNIPLRRPEIIGDSILNNNNHRQFLGTQVSH
ncbi:uncharacterized protein LOC111689075 [Lucilia cuprina]|uniref:uncharacterized protein LOC111689075 n=1 Tax=Lucilia cuprina TaxID=7375 RepID=UPI001F06CB7F|nr:uncharacterized protein LOC111689075 [Lucilia cuprina]